jgi:hypothetical protein
VRFSRLDCKAHFGICVISVCANPCFMTQLGRSIIRIVIVVATKDIVTEFPVDVSIAVSVSVFVVLATFDLCVR